MKKLLPELLAALLACATFSACASEAKLQEVDLPKDTASLQRGAETVATVCGGCHGLKYIKYADLLKLGIAKDKVDGWRNGQPLDTPLNPPMSEDAARAAFGGVVPPDLSLMAAAREGGGRYLYSYLTGYHKNEKGDLTNAVFRETRMPDVLGAADAADDAARTEVGNKAKDVSAFLVWAADPHAPERERLGFYVLVYVAVLTVLLYLWKRQIWAEIDRRPKIK